jgi:hypothetical protein
MALAAAKRPFCRPTVSFSQNWDCRATDGAFLAVTEVAGGWRFGSFPPF